MANNTTTNGTESTPNTPVSVNDGTALDELVDEHDVVLADFYADWCGPCQMLEPTLEQLAADTVATVAKVDVDANPQLAASFGVQGVPTLVLFADGELVDRMVGLQSKEQFEATIEDHTE
ncbi:thioredoxin [Halorussus amylolyticus]|uniref:thioredoxin n=1 Tax=Halorussus amylolyticus TaxID=1126242 RepID=UPI001047888A|nr:thioredoxin [Halorussus amylolyticus]